LDSLKQQLENDIKALSSDINDLKSHLSSSRNTITVATSIESEIKQKQKRVEELLIECQRLYTVPVLYPGRDNGWYGKSVPEYVYPEHAIVDSGHCGSSTRYCAFEVKLN